MTDMLNKLDYDGYDEAMAYFEQEEQKNTPSTKSELVLDKEEEKCIHRKHRKNARKAKKHQLKLATSVKRKRKSLYRWNPVWHKMKLADISPKKIKADSKANFEPNALKEINND